MLSWQNVKVCHRRTGCNNQRSRGVLEKSLGAGMSAFSEFRPAIGANIILGIIKKLERTMGIEPTYAAWEAAVLPLNYVRLPTGVRYWPV